MLLKICITLLTVSHPIRVPSPRRGADSIGQMGVEEPPRQSRQSGVGSFPRAAAASGIMNRHDPRRRRPQTATVAAASIRSRVRRRIRAHTRRHLRGRFSQSERFVSPSARSAPQQLGAVLARVRFRLDPTCSASCSLGS